MASSMEAAIDSLKDMMMVTAVQRVPRSEALEIETRAIEAIEMDEGFSAEDFADAAMVIANNPSLANVYLHIKNKAARTSYLLHYMEKLRRDD
jgi:hypothetical protein